MSFVRSLLLVLLISTASAPARAQAVDEGTRAAARDLGYAGVAAFEAKDYAVAATKLDKAFRVLRAPSLGLWSARAFAKVGKLLEASERYREVGRMQVQGGDVDVQKQAQTDAVQELEALIPRIPVLIVELEGATASEATFTLDGAPLATELVGESRPVNPGAHRVEARRGSAVAQAEASVAEGERKTVLLKFDVAPGSALSAPAPVSASAPGSAPATPTPDRSSASPRRTFGWIALGLGGAGLAVGGVTGLLAMGRYAKIEKSPLCTDDNRCAPSEQDLVDSYSSMRTISTVGFIAGGAIAATGVILLLTAKSPGQPQAALSLTPTSASVMGSF